MKWFMFFFLLIGHAYADGGCVEHSRVCKQTKLGVLSVIDSSSGGSAKIYLNETLIYEAITSYFSFSGDQIFVYDKNKKPMLNKTIMGYSSPTPCVDGIVKLNCNMYIVLDFSQDKLIISNAFYPADTQSNLTWTSWGKKNAVFGFDDDSQFRYENGKVTMIDGGYTAKERNKEKSSGKSNPGIDTVMGALTFVPSGENTRVLLNNIPFYIINGSFYKGMLVNPVKNNEQDVNGKIKRTVVYASILEGCAHPEDVTQCYAYYLFDFTGKTPIGVGPMYTNNSNSGLLLTDWIDQDNALVNFGDGTQYKYSKGELKKVK
ncbi:hypothetical protein [Pectobacterium sp. B1J-3]|uniref:hypothetical protein n=1 Tax=Pectobacterium sp. B1J-3 TaxID=3385371 RepID=UPI00390639C4